MMVCRQACPQTVPLIEFVMVSGCAAQDVHNAFRRSLLFRFSDYVTVESLRNSVSSIYRYLGQWIALRLKFKDQETPKFFAHRKAFWFARSVDHEVAELLAEDRQFKFARSVPRVASICQDRGDVVGLITDTFKTTWRFTKLSGSRWVTIGPASQAVVVSALCGLENLVSLIRSRVGRSHIIEVGGFARFQERKRELMVQAAIVCRVSDSVLQLLMKDPRVSVRRNLESCIRRAPLGCVFGRQCDALARRRGRGRSR